MKVKNDNIRSAITVLLNAHAHKMHGGTEASTLASCIPNNLGALKTVQRITCFDTNHNLMIALWRSVFF